MFNVRFSSILKTFFFFTSFCSAQSVWHAGETQKEFSVEYIHPELKDESGTFTGYGINFTGRISLSESKTLLLQIPYINGTYEFNTALYHYYVIPTKESESILGNFYVGLESKKEGGRSFFNLGVYIPTTPDDKLLATIVGLYTDPDRYESYIPNYLIPSFRINNYIVRSEDENFGLLARAGVSGLILTKRQDPSQDSFEALLSYALQAQYSSDEVNFIFGFSGKLNLTQDGDISNRVLHQLGAAVSYRVQKFRPEIFVRVPINNALSEGVKSVFGGSLAIEL
jgi:hypothetical protein